MLDAYRAFLRGAIRARWLTIGLTLAMFVAAIFLSHRAPRQFFPASDRPELTVDMTLRQNASIYATETQAKRLEALLKHDPDIDHFSTYVGRGAIRFILTLNVQLADRLCAVRDRGRGFEARERLQKKLELALAEKFPDVSARASPLELGPPVGWPLQYRISGPDKDEVRRLSLEFARFRAAIRGHAMSISPGWSLPARYRCTSTRTKRAGSAQFARSAAVLNAAVLLHGPPVA